MAGMNGRVKLYKGPFVIESVIGTKFNDKELLSVNRALTVLIDNGFKVFSSWDSLARELDVPLDFRRQLKYTASLTGDYRSALEESLDHWVTNDSNRSWAVLLSAVERTDEKEVARKLYKQFGIDNPNRSSSSGSTGNSSGKPLPAEVPPKVNETKTLRTFMQIQEDLQPLLQLSLTDFASRCFSKGLISMEMYDKVFNSTSSSDAERAMYLIHLICKRAESFENNGQRSEARELIHNFGKVVSDVDIVLRRIGTEIMSMNDSRSLMIKNDKVKCSIQSCLNSIATKLMSRGIITDDEYDAVTDPDANHSKRHMTEIFRALKVVIKQDRQKYEDLLIVFRDMGPPISKTVERIVDGQVV